MNNQTIYNWVVHILYNNMLIVCWPEPGTLSISTTIIVIHFLVYCILTPGQVNNLKFDILSEMLLLTTIIIIIIIIIEIMNS